MNITEFLLARIAEDEAVATDCLAVPFGYSWRTISWLHGANREHGKRHSPTRVLAECAAKRSIVEMYEGAVRVSDLLGVMRADEARAITDASSVTVEGVLRHLAAVYDQHPDYDPAWRIA